MDSAYKFPYCRQKSLLIQTCLVFTRHKIYLVAPKDTLSYLLMLWFLIHILFRYAIASLHFQYSRLHWLLNQSGAPKTLVSTLLLSVIYRYCFLCVYIHSNLLLLYLFLFILLFANDKTNTPLV